MDQLEQYRLHDKIICIDLKCFFASVECLKRDKDPFTHDLVVSDTSRGKSSIILAISPSLKNKGVSSRCRIFELPKHLKIEFAKPKMASYIEASNNILKMYLEHFSRDDILVYSIDEVFIDASSYLKLYDCSVYELTLALLRKIKREFGLTAVAGIGENMLLAKLAMDIEAKHTSDNIAMWTHDNFAQKLWPITDLKSVWGIGRGIEKRLHNLGINSMDELAHFNVRKLVKEFGIMGEELYLHANGIDISKIQQQARLTNQKAYTIGHTLFKNTPKNQVKQPIKELVIQLAHRLREHNKTTSVVQLYIRYASDEGQPSYHRQHKLANPTIELNELMTFVMSIFDNEVLDLNIRKIGISFSMLKEFNGIQLNIFNQDFQRSSLDLDFAYDQVNAKYGDNTIYKASALTKDSHHFKRSKLIGGHNAE